MKVSLSAHAKKRMKLRRITEDDVLQAIRYPRKTRKKYGLYYIEYELPHGSIELVYDRKQNHINIITIYWI
ncbi:DUF4258 domain-containing protein [Nanoarchaeota archaeon]